MDGCTVRTVFRVPLLVLVEPLNPGSISPRDRVLLLTSLINQLLVVSVCHVYNLKECVVRVINRNESLITLREFIFVSSHLPLLGVKTFYTCVRDFSLVVAVLTDI